MATKRTASIAGAPTRIKQELGRHAKLREEIRSDIAAQMVVAEKRIEQSNGHVENLRPFVKAWVDARMPNDTLQVRIARAYNGHVERMVDARKAASYGQQILDQDEADNGTAGGDTDDEPKR